VQARVVDTSSEEEEEKSDGDEEAEEAEEEKSAPPPAVRLEKETSLEEIDLTFTSDSSGGDDSPAVAAKKPPAQLEPKRGKTTTKLEKGVKTKPIRLLQVVVRQRGEKIPVVQGWRVEFCGYLEKNQGNYGPTLKEICSGK
jgi:hypothetical protein